MAAGTNAGFVNINSDLGESFGPWVMGNDAEVLKIVKSANIACGFHASDPTVMVDTVKLCKDNGVSIGAHPGFADLQGFGRRAINLTVKELEANIAYQLGALQAIAAMQGLKVTHIKPHGMMGNMSAESAEMSEAICRATRAIDRDIVFLAQANTEQGKAARKAGIQGIVLLEATTDEQGNVVNVKVLKSIPELDQAAIDAVKQWRYAPLVLNGTPTPFVLSVTLNFSVKEG